MEFKNRILSLLTLGAVVCPGFAVDSALRHRKLMVPLSNCADDCMTMPLILGFESGCDATCQLTVVQNAGVVKPNFRHLSGVGMMFIDVVSDGELALLQEDTSITFIECDSCITSSAQEPVCGSNDKTYTNVDEFNCGLKCRGADSSVTMAYQGVCRSGSALQSVDEVSIENCPAGGSLNFPLIITFTDACGTTCAIQTMQKANIEKTMYDHLTSLNFVVLNGATDDEIAVLRSDTESVKSMECDSTVQASEVALENCPADDSLTLPLMIGFTDTCDVACAAQTMQRANIDKSKFDQLVNTNIIVLNGVTDSQLTALRSDTQYVKSIECDSPVQTLISLTSCADDCMSMPLIITFSNDCDTTCASEAMKAAQVSKPNYQHLAALNMIILSEVTDSQLEDLRRDSLKISSIECNSCVFGDEVAQVCGSDGITYKNQDKLSCDLQCRGADSSVTMAYFGVCQADPSMVVPLANCDDDCMTLPLLITFKDTCDTTCAVETMKGANIDKTKYDHLVLTGIILLNEVTDQELAALQTNSETIASIECDSCVIVDEVAQVCGTDDVTYKNEDELNCGLNCRGADKTVTVASKGACARTGIDELVTLTCDSDCMRMPLMIGFKGDCDNACAVETMQRANIPKTDYDNLVNINMMMLNTVTDEQLMILRGENEYIIFMECDTCVGANVVPVCASNGRTFRSAEDLTCENQCRGTDGGISIAYDGPCTDESTSAPTDGGGGPGIGICFSSTNQVRLSNGETKQINQLQLGDEVLTQTGYENVYSWSHYNSEKEAKFVQLLPSRVELSPNHLIFLKNGISVPAGTIKAGDVLLSGEVVASVRSVKRLGAYAPFTNSGTIIVNGQVASTFVSLQEESNVLLLNGDFSTGISHQWLAHAFEVPHRLWCSAMGCTKESYTVDGISTWVAAPLRFFTWFLQLPMMLQLIFFIPILSLFSTFLMLELIVKNYFVTAATLLGITAAYGLSSGFPVRRYKKCV